MKFKFLKVPESCKDCGSTQLTWHADVRNYGGVQDGRLKMNEIGPIFYLGCDECSATLKIVDGDAIANEMNQ